MTVVWIAGGVGLAVAIPATWLTRLVARRVGAVARPRDDRWHTKPTALFGGVGIFVAFAAAFAAAFVAAEGWQLSSVSTPTWWPQGLVWLLICSAAMFALGLVDDIVRLRPAAKLAGQMAVAALFTAFGPRLVYAFHPVADTVITILWLVGITNAINLLDNLDGQSAGVTAIAAGFLTFFFMGAGQVTPAVITLALAAVCLGFLVFNWNPASIFMGDCGSHFLGFLLAGVTLFNQTHRTRNLLATLAVPLLLLLVPILDTMLVALLRKRHGRPVTQGGTDHISHRLVALGLSERATVLAVYGVAVASGLMAIWVRQLPLAVALAIIPIFFGGILFGLMVVGRVRVYRPDRPRREASDGSAPAPARRRAIVKAIDAASRGPVLMVLYDLLAVVFCYYLAFLLRFGEDAGQFFPAFARSLPVVVSGQMALLWLAGLYKPIWRFGGLTDFVRIGFAVLVAVAGSVAASTFLFRFERLSRAAFVIDGVLLLAALGFGRFVGRATRTLSRHQAQEGSRRALLFGAGAAGDAAVRELRENPRWRLHPVGFLDDDPQKHDRMVQGLRIYGSRESLAPAAKARRAEVVLVTVQDLPDDVWEKLRSACVDAELELLRFRLAIEPVAGKDRDGDVVSD